ncbi:hypothetical protein [Nocardia brasiliensis]
MPKVTSAAPSTSGRPRRATTRLSVPRCTATAAATTNTRFTHITQRQPR